MTEQVPQGDVDPEKKLLPKAFREHAEMCLEGVIAMRKVNREWREMVTKHMAEDAADQEMGESRG